MTDRYDPANWPPWAFKASTVLAGVLAAMMIATATQPLVITPLALIVVLPWLFHIVGKHPPVWLFLTLSTVPLVVMNTFVAAAAGDALLLTACMALYVQGESVAAYRPRDAVLGVVAGAVVLVLHADISSIPALYIYSGCVGAVTIGFLIRKQQETVMELRATQDQLVGEAALRERQRIAREVHDVVAHSLTVTMMHVTAARMAIRRDPASATEALEEAERLGRRSLDEIRRTVSVLRSGEERSTDRALPTAAELDGLIEGYRAAGVDVSYVVVGDLDTIDAQTGLAVYRIVQEAVANAAKHAPGAPVEVAVQVDDGQVRITASNPMPARTGARPPSGGGMGLVGMRERLELLGGAVTAGPRDDHWIVSATVDGASDKDVRPPPAATSGPDRCGPLKDRR